MVRRQNIHSPGRNFRIWFVDVVDTGLELLRVQHFFVTTVPNLQYVGARSWKVEARAAVLTGSRPYKSRQDGRRRHDDFRSDGGHAVEIKHLEASAVPSSQESSYEAHELTGSG